MLHQLARIIFLMPTYSVVTGYSKLKIGCILALIGSTIVSEEYIVMWSLISIHPNVKYYFSLDRIKCRLIGLSLNMYIRA